AARWAWQAALSTTGRLDLGREFEHLTWARLLLAQGQTQAARKQLARLRRAARQAGRWQSVLETLILPAQALQAGGHTLRALSALRQAVVLAEPTGQVQTFVDEGEVVAGLLARLSSRLAKRSPSLDCFVEKLIGAFPRPVSAGGPAVLLDPL